MDTQLMVSNFMPALTFEDVVLRRNKIVEFAKQVMVEEVDYGKVPGTTKPTLFKPGAEKLITLFGLSPKFNIVKSIEDWHGKETGEPFFFYLYQCQLYRGDYLVGEGDGSCNSHETKYRYRWVNEQDLPQGIDKTKLRTRGGRTSEFDFAIEKAETAGQYGKPAAYWQQFKDAIANGKATRTQRKTKAGKSMDAWEIDSTLYCIPNEDIADQANTILKMSQKRALIAATLIAVNASEFFTQDIEDMVIDVDFTVKPKEALVVEKEPVVEKPVTENKDAKAEPPKQSPANGSEKHDFKTSRTWSPWLKQVAKEIPYFSINGKENPKLVIDTLKGMGRYEFTDENANELRALLSAYAENKTTPQKETKEENQLPF